jgi:hypothetical protein
VVAVLSQMCTGAERLLARWGAGMDTSGGHTARR